MNRTPTVPLPQTDRRDLIDASNDPFRRMLGEGYISGL